MSNKKIKKDLCFILDHKLSVGYIVWGKLGSYKWWPAVIIKSSDCGQPEAKFGNLWVFWFGDHKVSEISRRKLVGFVSNFSQIFTESSGKFHEAAIYEALKVLASRCDYHYESIKSLISWAKEGFKTSDQTLLSNTDIPSLVIDHLKHILRSNQNKESHCDDAEAATCTSEQMFLSNIPLRKVREGLLKIQDVCIACYDNKLQIVAYHPMFEGGLCFQCKERLQENVYAYGNDGKNMCCIICAKPGALILCDNINCHRSYCFNCIALLVSPEDMKKIVETNPWYCFFCSPSANDYGLLQVKKDWEKRLLHFFQPIRAHIQEVSLLDYAVKKPIKVLSLFDGISTGKLVLNYLSIDVEKYYASEIDEDSINVSKLHHRDSITYIGDVTLLSEEKIQLICPIDLVIGGSPCNDLSLVNPARKGIYGTGLWLIYMDLSDKLGTGKLFFDFFHVLKTVQRLNNGKHVFFLYENVAAMRHKDKRIISSFLMQEPALIDAKYVSPQTRPRFFWGNIPGMHMFHKYCSSLHNDMMSDAGYQQEKLLSHCILKNLGRTARVEKIRTVTTQKNSLVQDNYNFLPVEMNGDLDVLWVTELEKIFGFPMHYTDTGNLNINKRRELLGRAWSVPVISDILRPLKNFFKLTNDA